MAPTPDNSTQPVNQDAPASREELLRTAELTHAMEDYTKAIYKIQEQDLRPTTVRIAKTLDVTPASVTVMLQRLAKLGLVNYVPYRGVDLTETGMRVALEVIRHHRLLELYLVRQLGYSWDEVDEEAEKLEHVISEEFEKRIDHVLGHPETDPHGHPIPSAQGHISRDDTHIALAGCEEGQSVVVKQVSDEDAESLRHLGSLGIYPGARMDIIAGASEAQGVRVRVGGETHSVDTPHATQVLVELV